MLVIGKSPDWAPGKVRRIQDDIRLLISRTLSFDSAFLWLCEILLFCTKASDIAVAQKRFRGLLKPAKETASQIESLTQICLGDSESFDNVKGYTTEELVYQITAKLLPGWTSVRNARFENQDGPVCGTSNLDVFFGRGEYNRHQVQLMIDGNPPL